MLVYQYGITGIRNEYFGYYEAIIEDEKIINFHPNSTLKKPPKVTKKQVACFDEEKNKWVKKPVLPDLTLYYRDKVIGNKADVNRITEAAIKELGEDKVKTLKMIAGDDECPEWDEFVEKRRILVEDGGNFIAENGLDIDPNKFPFVMDENSIPGDDEGE